MNTKQINDILKKNIFTRKIFQGVYARDQLKKIHVPENKRSAYVVHTEPLRIKVGHWICIIFEPDGSAIFIDSFGIDLTGFHPDIQHFVKKNSNQVFQNKRLLQDVTSSTCGLYVLYFIYQKSKGKSLKEMLKPFHSFNTKKNDRWIIRHIQKIVIKQ